jgi:hypothetical protein
VTQVLDVFTTQFRSLPGSYCLLSWVPRDRRADLVAFVQVHIASLAWAPFTLAAVSPRPFPSQVRGQDDDKDMRSSW